MFVFCLVGGLVTSGVVSLLNVGNVMFRCEMLVKLSCLIGMVSDWKCLRLFG